MEEIVRNFLQSIFFKTQLTFLDFVIIGLGIFIALYQILKRIMTFSKLFYRKAQKDRLFLKRTEVKLNYIGSLIELLPILGILGTVWGLRNALVVIANTQNPTIKHIATEIAPALSTTFFGLLFAAINLVLFNYLQAYFSELIYWCKQNISVENQQEAEHEKTGIR